MTFQSRQIRILAFLCLINQESKHLLSNCIGTNSYRNHHVFFSSGVIQNDTNSVIQKVTILEIIIIQPFCDLHKSEFWRGLLFVDDPSLKTSFVLKKKN